MEKRKIEQKLEAYSSNYKYIMDINLMMDYYPNRIISMIKDKKDTADLSFLELGLGHGNTTEVFKHFFSDYTVIDGDIEIIEAYKKQHNDNIKFVHSFFENYNTDKQYDIIVAGFILEHVDNPVEILKKFKNNLKDDGLMYVAVPNACTLNRRVGHEAGLLPDLLQLSQSDLDLGHKRYYTVDTIKKDCITAGYKVNAVEGIYLKPLTTAQMAQLDLSYEIMMGFCKVGKDFPELCVGILLELTK